MLNRNTLVLVVGIAIVLVAPAFAETLEGNYNDMLHYLKIGRFDLAKGYAQAVLDSNSSPVDLFALADGNPQGYALIIKAKESSTDTELVGLCGKVVDIIEQGRFIRRSDPKVIVDEITRLSGTARGRLNAIKRLQNAGEYAIMYMIDALGDDARKAEWPDISSALGQMSKEAIRPLAAALQTNNVGVKSEIIKALGKIGYPQSLPYLKYVAEKDSSAELRGLAEASIKKIDAGALKVPAAQLCYRLGEDYYYHAESLAPSADANFANMWFWDANNARLYSERVDKRYFNELMSMRCCEWSLKADDKFGQAIGLWLAAFFKAESYDIDMPAYFSAGHANARTYATTAGPEYLHQALARAMKDKDAQVALGVVEALSTTAGESSLFYRVGTSQPLAEALLFDSKAVKFSAAIAIAAAGPKQAFPESKLVVANLAEALAQSSQQSADDNTPMWNGELADLYALRAAKVMFKLAQTCNLILDLSAAQDVLVTATKDKRTEIQMLAGQILAHLNTPAAQEAIATMAMTEGNSKDIRISAFVSLAVSAQVNGNKLDDAAINALYALVSSKDVDPGLRAAAAAAYGALNLPSQKVKTLILDQARS
ncbi:MAG: HEAT repeat domain-containing protein [Sedimentisphaerales bacterium]|jgi:HEAT repeat protein